MPVCGEQLSAIAIKFMLMADLKSPNPAFSKGDFKSKFFQFPPLKKGGVRGIYVCCRHKTFGLRYKPGTLKLDP
jgi:hypothetical protein